MSASGAPGRSGCRLPGVSVRLLNHELQPVADGETGEMYLRGPNIFAGYWRREEATRAAFVDGYFRTGDLAERSADGYYTLLRAQERPDHFGRLQCLSARDRGVSGRAAGSGRSGGGRRCRTACAAKCRWRIW